MRWVKGGQGDLVLAIMPQLIDALYIEAWGFRVCK